MGCHSQTWPSPCNLQQVALLTGLLVADKPRSCTHHTSCFWVHPSKGATYAPSSEYCTDHVAAIPHSFLVIENKHESWALLSFLLHHKKLSTTCILIWNELLTKQYLNPGQVGWSFKQNDQMTALFNHPQHHACWEDSSQDFVTGAAGFWSSQQNVG